MEHTPSDLKDNLALILEIDLKKNTNKVKPMT